MAEFACEVRFPTISYPPTQPTPQPIRPHPIRPHSVYHYQRHLFGCRVFQGQSRRRCVAPPSSPPTSYFQYIGYLRSSQITRTSHRAPPPPFLGVLANLGACQFLFAGSVMFILIISKGKRPLSGASHRPPPSTPQAHPTTCTLHHPISVRGLDCDVQDGAERVLRVHVHDQHCRGSQRRLRYPHASRFVELSNSVAGRWGGEAVRW